MGDGPLAGTVVLVTRPEPRDGPLLAMLRDLGAEALAAPVIRIEPSRGAAFPRAIRETAEGRFAWVVFTSAATVDAWFERAFATGLDARSLRAQVAAVGPGTERALAARGVRADLVPSSYTTAALGRAFPKGAGRVLLPRADIAPEELERLVERKGWSTVRVEAYRTKPVRALPADARGALRDGRVDVVTFTSASTVDAFRRLAAVPRGTKVVAIGPVTARAAREAGLRVHAVARPHTVEGVVEAMTRLLRPRSARVRPSTTREAR